MPACVSDESGAARRRRLADLCENLEFATDTPVVRLPTDIPEQYGWFHPPNVVLQVLPSLQIVVGMCGEWTCDGRDTVVGHKRLYEFDTSDWLRYILLDTGPNLCKRASRGNADETLRQLLQSDEQPRKRHP